MEYHFELVYVEVNPQPEAQVWPQGGCILVRDILSRDGIVTIVTRLREKDSLITSYLKINVSG